MAGKLKPSLEISVDNGWTTILTLSSFKNNEIKFKIDEEFDEVTGDDKKLKVWLCKNLCLLTAVFSLS